MVALASLLAVLLAPAAALAQKFGGDDQLDRTVSAQDRQEVIDGVHKAPAGQLQPRHDTAVASGNPRALPGVGR